MAQVRQRAERLPPEERRRELLDAARAVIAAEGFDGLSVRAVADRAGVTRPVVYDLFGDLDRLVLALFDREEEAALSPLLALIGEGDPVGVDPEDFLVEAVEGFLAAVRSSPETWQLVLVPPQGVSAEVRARFAEGRHRISERVTELLDWGVAARGGPAGLDHELFARLIVAAGEDAARLTLRHPRRYPPERLASLARTGLAVLPADARPRGATPPSRTGATPPAPSSGAASARNLPRRERKEQLLDVTLELIAASGWDALSIEAIARRAGITRPVVYRSYPNLQLLLLALLRREDAHTRRLLDSLLPDDVPDGAAPEVLLATLARFLDGVMAHPRTYRVVLQRPESAPPVLRKLVDRRRAALAEQLVPVVRLGLDGIAAATTEIDEDVLARLLLSTGEELARLALDDPRFPVERILASAWTLLDLVPLR